MIDQEQIQRAHDILIEVVTGRVQLGIGGDDKRCLHSSLDALCWVLRHDHNQVFANNLAEVERLIEQRGYEIINTGRLQVGRPKL